MRSTSLQMRSDSAQMSWVKRAVAIGALAFEQLRRAPDAGERVLDLMREHGGEAGDRARGAAMGELALDHLRHAALLEHDQDAAGHLRRRGRRRDRRASAPRSGTSRDRRHIR